MLREKTSVHFITAKGNGNRVMLVPTFILLYWKKILFTFTGIVLVLFMIIGFFIYQKTSQHYQEELARANFVKRQVDLHQLRQSFKSIDATILKINRFMKARGLGESEIKNVGTADHLEITDVNKTTKTYDEKLHKASEILAEIPLGRPHTGNITSFFGTRNNPFSGLGAERHSGIDFKGNIGENVRSTADGIISFAGVKGGYGNCIIIDHGFDLQTLYGHLSKIDVVSGQKVNLGQNIGEIGSTGRSTGPHLHYEVHFENTRVNPSEYLKF